MPMHGMPTRDKSVAPREGAVATDGDDAVNAVLAAVFGSKSHTFGRLELGHSDPNITSCRRD